MTEPNVGVASCGAYGTQSQELGRWWAARTVGLTWQSAEELEDDVIKSLLAYILIRLYACPCKRRRLKQSCTWNTESKGGTKIQLEGLWQESGISDRQEPDQTELAVHYSVGRAQHDLSDNKTEEEQAIIAKERIIGRQWTNCTIKQSAFWQQQCLPVGCLEGVWWR